MLSTPTKRTCPVAMLTTSSVIAALLFGVGAPASGQDVAPPQPLEASGLDLGGEEDGGGFFDPGKLSGARELSIQGFIDATVFAPLAPSRLGEFGFTLPTLALFLGSPIYGDSVYASSVVETGGHQGGQGEALAIESATIQYTPSSWFELVGGYFIVPFGLEDGDHASPVNPLVTRPISMAGTTVYPGSWSDFGVHTSLDLERAGRLTLFVIQGNIVHHRADLAGAALTLNPPAQGLTLADVVEEHELRVIEQAHGLTGGLNSLEATRLHSFGATLHLNRLGDRETMDLGGSFLFGRHGHVDSPEGLELFNYAFGLHLDVDLSKALIPLLGAITHLPSLRAEYVMVHEQEAVRGASVGEFDLGERDRFGYYVQLLQPLPLNVDLIFRYDVFDPDLEAPGDRGLDMSIGLRWRPVPDVTLKLETQFNDAQGSEQTGGNSAAAQASVAW